MNENQVENSLQIEKIVVTPEDELVDILKSVEKSKADRIILTFAEPSDLLISPINLKVLQDSADDAKKPLISLIIQNPTGVRNAKEAGMTVTETSGSVVDTFWDQAETNMNERIELKKNNLKRSNTKTVSSDKNEEIVPTEDAMDPEMLNNQRTEFQKSIAQAIEKSRQGIAEKKRLIEENGVMMALDQEIGQEESPSLLGKNFKQGQATDQTFVKPEQKTMKKKFEFPKIAFPKSIGGVLLKVFLPLFVVLGIAAYIAYIMLPLVKVKIYVESKNVTIDKVFTGNPKVTEFNLANYTVPVKKEESNKSASNSVTATGVGYKGTKAEGVVIVKYYDIIGNPTGVTLKAGTVITSTAGLKYEITTDAKVDTFPELDAIPVKSVAVGEEYNLAAGQLFTVAGYTSAQMDASNISAFEGGAKTAYTVLAKSDVDKVANDLKKNLIKEAESELRGKVDDTWTLIDKSLTSAIDGAPETDVPIGAEADTINVTVKTKSTALFFQKSAIESSINEMLTKAAQEKNLFTSSGASTLVLDENLTKEITILEIKKDAIKVSLKASSNIQPKIDKNELKNSLKGKSWKEGLSIVNALKYTNQDNTVEFLPTNFPDWLKYFPSRQGRLFIDTEEVKAQ